LEAVEPERLVVLVHVVMLVNPAAEGAAVRMDAVVRESALVTKKEIYSSKYFYEKKERLR